MNILKNMCSKITPPFMNILKKKIKKIIIGLYFDQTDS